MFKSVKEFDIAVFEILTKIRDVVGYSELSSMFGDENYDDALEYCVQQNFVIGYKVGRASSGKLLADIVGNPRLTRNGLQFIEGFKP